VQQRLLTLLVSLVLVLPLIALAADELLVSAKRQLDNGNPQAAYNLLIPLQSERAGDPEYDFLLGSAAMGIGKNTEAVFALERVLAVRPDATAARALIGFDRALWDRLDETKAEEHRCRP